MKFFMLIGLPGSGKSTYAKKLKEIENANIYSSDAIREELYGSEDVQGDPTEIFSLLHTRVKADLAAQRNVIYDATNIAAKRRIGFLQEINKVSCEKIAIVFATPYAECLRRNAGRDRQVPEQAIERMYHQFDIPSYAEGFTDIQIIYPDDSKLSSADRVIEEIKCLPHDNPHHTFPIGRHMSAARDYLEKHYAEELAALSHQDRLSIYFATLLHDIGKPAAKIFQDSKGNQTEIAHYYNHEHIGAYEVLQVDIPDSIKLDVALLINYHMRPFVWEKAASIKLENADRKKLGTRLSYLLDILHDCDMNSM